MSAIPCRRFAYSLITNARDTQPRCKECDDFGAFALQLAAPEIRGRISLEKYRCHSNDKRVQALWKAQKDGPAWIPGTFTQGGRRQDSDVRAVYALVLDFDDGVDRAVIESTLNGYRYAAHTSYSHHPQAPKWRVIIPLAQPVPPAVFAEVWQHFNQLFDGKADPSGKNPSHLYYLPAVPPGGAAFYEQSSADGEAFNPAILEPRAAAQPSGGAPAGDVALIGELPADLQQLLREGKPPGERSEAIFRVLLALFRAGADDDAAFSVLMDTRYALSEKCRAQGEKWLRAEITRARRKAAERTKPVVDARQVSPTADATDAEMLDDDCLVAPPVPTQAMLYGLAGDVGLAAAATTEANPYATTINYLTFVSAMAGRSVYLAIGNTWHHPRLYDLHVGRSGRGRKGDALSLTHRIRRLLAKALLGLVHTGGLSSREGLVALIADAPIDQANADTGLVDQNPDKRLWVVESEFANILHQAKREGNTLSAALRDAWDGLDLKPATKHSKTFCTAPHIALSAGVTPGELLALIEQRELTNGFAGRFLIFWAERMRLEPEPSPTPDAVLADLVKRTEAVIRFAKGNYPDPNAQDRRRASLTPSARATYRELYQGELNEPLDGELLNALLERRAPMLLRIALLFALTDQTLLIESCHLEAALAWIRYWRDSVRFIFAAYVNEAKGAEAREHGKTILQFLSSRGAATKRDLLHECFHRHESASKIDAALNLLLNESKVDLIEEPRSDGQPGKGRKIYRIAKQPATIATIAQASRKAKGRKGRKGRTTLFLMMTARKASCERGHP